MKHYILFLVLFFFAAQAVFAQTVFEKPDYSTTGDNNVKVFAAHYNQYCGGAPISDEEQKKYDIPSPLGGLNLYVYRLDSSNMSIRVQDLQTNNDGIAQMRLPRGRYLLTNHSHADNTVVALAAPDYYQYQNGIIQVFFEVENIKKTVIVGYSTATRCPYPDRP